MIILLTVSQEVYTLFVILFLICSVGENDITSNITGSVHPPVILFPISKRRG